MDCCDPHQLPQAGDFVPQADPPLAIPRGDVPEQVYFFVNGIWGIPLLQAKSRQDIPGLDGANEDDIYKDRPPGSKVAYKLTVRGS